MRDIDIIKDIFGEEIASKLCEEFGGSLIYIPKKSWDEKDVIEDINNNISLKDIQKKYNISFSKAYQVYRKYLRSCK